MGDSILYVLLGAILAVSIVILIMLLQNKANTKNEVIEEKKPLDYCKTCGAPIFDNNHLHCYRCGSLLNDDQKVDEPIYAPDDSNGATVVFIEDENDEKPSCDSNKNLNLKIILNEEIIELDVNKFPIIIGRQKDKADLVLNDTSVGRIHAEIKLINNEIFITDLNSTNGVYINNNRIIPNKDYPILTGDVLKIGRAKIEIL